MPRRWDRSGRCAAAIPRAARPRDPCAVPRGTDPWRAGSTPSIGARTPPSRELKCAGGTHLETLARQPTRAEGREIGAAGGQCPDGRRRSRRSSRRSSSRVVPRARPPSRRPARHPRGSTSRTSRDGAKGTTRTTGRARLWPTRRRSPPTSTHPRWRTTSTPSTSQLRSSRCARCAGRTRKRRGRSWGAPNSPTATGTASGPSTR